MVLTTEKQAAQIAGSGPGSGTAAKRKRKINLVPYGFLSPTILLVVVLMLIPIVMVIWYSLMDNVITKKNPKFVGFSNYAEVLGSETFHTAILNTVFFTTVSVAAHLVLGLAFAMLLNTRFLKSFTKAIFRVIYVMPWLFTVAIIAILWRLLLSPNGIVNFLVMELGLSSTSVEWLASRDTALLAVTFINIWAGYPFFMVSLLAGLQGIPKDLYEAARVDGANPVQQFISITLPQLRPIIISMALLDLIWTSQQFALIWMTTGGGPISSTEMLSTFTYKLAFSEYNFSMAAASAVIILAFSMVLAFFYVRYQKARD
ncbi:multiple sugar transport system permease protein [Arthrobacter sp. B3I9]|uniref:carbohydrate ABC transporter permease n=1 Tax=Arthrobacter sp. B3I9 TaxID=3042270 RepID=UPI00278CF202|nr:sugar ABC transporter permease [Arthrobacter sp. B3I9]MDQ0848913.1 multiple sugar transport system permease protein [Arthrobacter sp. B3I9]